MERVIAFYNCASGGTKNTINYANRKSVEIISILNN